MRYQYTMAALGLLACLAPLAACQKSDIKLPEDAIERAATCYAARITQVSGDKEILTPEQANDAAQFVYLGAVNDGIAEPSKLPEIASKSEALRPDIEKAGNAADYKNACAKAYPSTAPGSFKSLAADDRSTRMMCFTLSTAAMQTYSSSGITPPESTVRLNTKLDVQLRDEINAQGNTNVAELSGFAMRSMAKAVEAGPMNEVLAACVARYAAS